MSEFHESGNRVTITGIVPTAYSSAHELAQAFGSVVFEPDWWPHDVDELAYELYERHSGSSYQIGSVRTDGRPIALIGQRENPRARLAEENWYEPPEVKPLRGMVAETDIGYRAVLRHEQQTIHLIGYLTEAEVVRATLSLSRVMP